MKNPTKKFLTLKKRNLTSKDQTLKVLAYHAVSDVETFQKQMDYLATNYNLISLEELQHFFATGEGLPEKPLMITFDDGDISIYEKVLPIVKKDKIPTVVFIVTELLDTNKPFWWNEIEHFLGKKKGNKKVWEVKEWRNDQRLIYLKTLRENNSRAPLTHKQLSTDQVKEMQKEGMIIANHSHTHPMLNQCTVKEIKEEIETSMSVLDRLGLESRVFAYPNGNFSKFTEEVLVEQGVKMGFLFDHKMNAGDTDPLRISRLIVNDSTPLWKLKFILSGWHSKILPVTKRIGKLVK